MRRSTWVTIALLVSIVAIFIVAILVGTRASDAEEAFGGTDGAATTAIEDSGYEPWWEPIVAPAGEVESGLFALQAALGALLLGFVLGTLRERHRARTRHNQQPGPARTDGAPHP